VDIRNFVIDHVDRFLEYLKQNPLRIYSRRTVDAYLAAYALAYALGETVDVDVADWPPREGVCVGFKCQGMYITEWEIGVDDKIYRTEFSSISQLAAHIITSLLPLEEEIYRALFVGHYAWSVDYCEYKCQLPRELSRGGERLSIVFPFMEELPIERALTLSTLPIIPGVTGRVFDSLPGDAVRILDWVLGVVASEGFHTAVLDKAIRYYSPDIKAPDIAERLEADLANFIGKEIDVYVSNLAETFYTVIKRARDGVVAVQNPFYIHKLPPYISHYMKLVNWVALRYDASGGHLIALIPPPGQRAQLKSAAAVFAELGQVLEYPTHLLVYVEAGKYAEFLKAYEKVSK
jgi:hypothetical protein